MLERQVPDRESLKLGVAGVNAVLVIVVELGEAGGHLAAARTWRSHHDERPGGLDVVVLAVALVGDDMGDIGRIAGDGVVEIDLDPEPGQPLAERLDRGLMGVV